MRSKPVCSFILAVLLCVTAPALALKRSGTVTPSPAPVSTPTAAPVQIEGYGVVTADGTVLRVEPDGNSFGRRNLAKEEMFAFSEVLIGKDGQWWRHVNYEGIDGYVLAADVAELTEEEARALVATLTPTPTSIPTLTPKPSSKKTTVEVGDIIWFGHYEQDNNMANGKEPIEWLVLDAQGSEALLLSKYGLDAQPYHKTYTNITWEKCTLRSWLNGEFINDAFSNEEQEAIMLTNVDNEKSQGFWGIDGGNTTRDKLFLLSYAEAWKYFNSDKDRKCVPTSHAVANGAEQNSDFQVDGSGTCLWWLRSPGMFKNYGAYVNRIGSRGTIEVSISFNAIRPAFWVNLESEILQSENQF